MSMLSICWGDKVCAGNNCIDLITDDADQQQHLLSLDCFTIPVDDPTRLKQIIKCVKACGGTANPVNAEVQFRKSSMVLHADTLRAMVDIGHPVVVPLSRASSKRNAKPKKKDKNNTTRRRSAPTEASARRKSRKK